VSIQQALQEISSTVAVENVATLGQIRAESVAARSFAMQLLLGFAVVACLLTLAGIYGVLSLSVGARRREIAIRTAVGAEKRDVIGLVFREGVSVIAVGIVIGIVASVALSRVLGVFLFGVEPTDPLTLGVVGTLFAAVALLACFLPARRAAQADPMVALQDD
jgi:putative ABC transport system permease protein